MKNVWIAGIVIVAGLLLVGAAQNNTPQWEYAKYGELDQKYVWETGQEKIIGSEDDIRKFIGVEQGKYNVMAFLNYAGKEGWELCEVIIDSQRPNISYYFKRPK